MEQIRGTVIGQSLSVVYDLMAEGTNDYLEATFEFSPEWNGLDKWVKFCQDEKVWDINLVDDKVGRDKHLNLDEGYWTVCLYAMSPSGMRITTDVAEVRVRKSCTKAGEPPLEVPPSAAEQIALKADEALKNSEEMLRRADSGEFDGKDFTITKVYPSVEAMLADHGGADVSVGDFVLIETGNVDDPDNSKMYVKTDSTFEFVTDLSGSQGIRGPQGYTFTPTQKRVEGGVEVSWTNDGGLSNPPAVMLKDGPKGDAYTESPEFQKLSEQVRKDAESAGASAGNAKKSAEDAGKAQTAAEQAKTDAETAQRLAGEKATEAGTAAQNASNAQTAAETAAGNAQKSEQAASTQAGNAATEAGNAKKEADRAQTIADGIKPVEIDPTLTVAGAAADAKATGNKIDSLQYAFAPAIRELAQGNYAIAKAVSPLKQEPKIAVSGMNLLNTQKLLTAWVYVDERPHTASSNALGRITFGGRRGYYAGHYVIIPNPGEKATISMSFEGKYVGSEFGFEACGTNEISEDGQIVKANIPIESKLPGRLSEERLIVTLPKTEYKFIGFQIYTPFKETEAYDVQIELGAEPHAYTPCIEDYSNNNLLVYGRNLLNPSNFDLPKKVDKVEAKKVGRSVLVSSGSFAEQRNPLLIFSGNGMKIPEEFKGKRMIFRMRGGPIFNSVIVMTIKSEEVLMEHRPEEVFMIPQNADYLNIELRLYNSLSWNGLLTFSLEPAEYKVFKKIEEFKGFESYKCQPDGSVLNVELYSPNSTIYHDVPDGTVKVEYNVDTKAYIDNKFEQLQTAIVNNI